MLGASVTQSLLRFGGHFRVVNRKWPPKRDNDWKRHALRPTFLAARVTIFVGYSKRTLDVENKR